jgi:hypothetical protein
MITSTSASSPNPYATASKPEHCTTAVTMYRAVNINRLERAKRDMKEEA